MRPSATFPVSRGIRTAYLALVLAALISLSIAVDSAEANVMEAELDGERLSVTLFHDDSGEEGYADWWQVETPGGERLARRELLHSHGTRNFTRSETVEVPENLSLLVVRGHDQTHGYGGRALLLNLSSGETRAVDQGESRKDLPRSGGEKQAESGVQAGEYAGSESSSSGAAGGPLKLLVDSLNSLVASLLK